MKLKRKNSLKPFKNENLVIDWKDAIERKILKGNLKYRGLYIKLEKFYRYIGKS